MGVREWYRDLLTSASDLRRSSKYSFSDWIFSLASLSCFIVASIVASSGCSEDEFVEADGGAAGALGELYGPPDTDLSGDVSGDVSGAPD